MIVSCPRAVMKQARPLQRRVRQRGAAFLLTVVAIASIARRPRLVIES
jgi:hypothetical protein